MSISIKQSVIRNVEGKIKFKKFRPGGKEHFHLGIWIDGDDRELDEIKMVVYELHSSFKQPIRSSRNRKNGFSVTFWTWGMFNIKVKIHKQNGEIDEIDHYLEYKLPNDTGRNYVDVSTPIP